ncbi:MAG TPA: hypothetical protein GX391_05275 [Firmicutes bacterium]|nr:hypothetical protein [Bacillota bacterium]HOQ23546.1 hypothetical protein [Bacillota bacterium]HPT67281.1 hypothetical protein [Bacillota bacterium]
MLLGILIFLHILCVGLCLLLFLGLKELARRQRQLADRLGVVEELVIELSSATLESSGQDDTEQGALARHEAETRTDASGLAFSEELSATEEQEQEVDQQPVIVDERVKQIYDWVSRGESPEEIARRIGCGVGEINLVLSLYRRTTI